MIRALRCTALLVAVACAAPALAHRLSPSFFGLTETAQSVYAVQWKVSISGGLAGVLEPQVPAGCSLSNGVRTYTLDDVRLQHATQPARDMVLLARPGADGTFSVALPMLERSRWQVLVEGKRRDWRLEGAWQWPAEREIAIRAISADAQP